MRALEKIVPLSCIAVSVLALSPIAVVHLSLPAVVWIHLISYAALGICFEVPEISLNVLFLFWARSAERFHQKKVFIARALKIRYVLTHFIAPSTGIMTVTSGIYLTYRGGYSFQQGWLFWILCAATVGLYKGMCQHNAYIKSLMHLSAQDDTQKLRQAVLNRFNQILVLLELPTYIFIFWTASIKPNWINPLQNWIAPIEQWGSAWASGTLIILAGALLLIPLRYAMVRYSPVFRL